MSLISELIIATLRDDAPIESLLRKAYVVSKKLGLDDFSKIIYQELHGYTNIDDVPNYRVVKGDLRGLDYYSGWISAMVPPELEASLLLRRLMQPVAELKALYDSGDNPLIIGLAADVNEELSKIFEGPPTRFGVAISRASIYKILDTIKNLILTWALDLESAGIVGDGIEFSLTEIETAKSTPNIYNFTNNFFSNVEASQIQQGTIDSNMEA